MDYLQDLFGLKGKSAIITGASRGLGRAAALALNGAGANVVLIGRDAKMLEETKSLLQDPSNSQIIEGDVTSDESREKIISAVKQDFGKIDILINNAGIIHRNPVLEYSDEDWNDVIETNLTSVFKWSQSAAKEMSQTGGGRIINIS